MLSISDSDFSVTADSVIVTTALPWQYALYRTCLFTMVQGVIFIGCKYVIFLRVFRYLFGRSPPPPHALPSPHTGDGSGAGTDQSRTTWFSYYSHQEQLQLCGRTVIAIHHAGVAWYGILYLWTSNIYYVHMCIFLEIGADLFDIASIVYNRGMTGLNWQGMLLHHIVSVIMLAGSLIWGMDPYIAAQSGILLDGTGSTDYLFMTVIPKSPAYRVRSIFFLCLFQSIIFFTTRLFYFPFLAWWCTKQAFTTHIAWGILSLLSSVGFSYFNVGMISSRTRQLRRAWKHAQPTKTKIVCV